MLDYKISASYRLPEDISADCELLERSDLFDRAFYCDLAGLDAHSNAAAHYLLTGWRLGIEPSRNFEGRFLYPYFCSIGLDGPPALSYLSLQAAGWAVYPTRSSVEDVAKRIRGTVWFDPDSYSRRAGCADLDPLLHYLIVGEQIGHPPSDEFDPFYYRSRYADVEKSGMSFLAHFMFAGHAEGRRPLCVASQLTFDTARINPERQTVLVVIHQASRTGAPILAYNIAMRLSERYNVVGLLLAGGDLVADFQRCCTAIIGPLSYADWLPVEADYLVKRLIATYRISYAIANTIDTRLMMKPLACALIPVVALVHEFASYLSPKGEMGRSLEWATQIVFSAPSVAASAISDYENLQNRIIHILPQGQSKLPPAPTLQVGREQEQALRDALRPPGAENAFVVLGCGTIILRKGVDIFFSCAAAVAARAPKRPVRFVWIGSPVAPNLDGGLFTLLSEQIARSDLQGTVAMVDEIADLGPAYAGADLFLLSSRLDPLPNVAIDAATRGIPVVCFENAGGIADFLGGDSATRMSVVPYLDVHAAARMIAELADDPTKLENLGTATRRVAQKTFDMDCYLQKLDEIGRSAMNMMQQRSRDLVTIAEDPMFDTINFVGADTTVTTRDEAIRLFLARSAALGIGTIPTSNFYYRRPCPGFHPQIYARERSDHYDIATVNPLAHFIRSGKPSGPWRHQVIRPSAAASGSLGGQLRLALHGHFFYAELLADCLQKLQSARARCDLFLSTNDEASAGLLRETAAGYNRGTVQVRIVPNRGRDIGPFLTEFGDDLQDYDLIGHIHSKRSLFTSDPVIGESWREFLWQNLLGDIAPMMDIIAQAFSNDEALGLVFPDDPHLSDWDHNRDIAEQLAVRMGIKHVLPPFFNFPIGTMFWARPKALAPLFSLRLQWDDYPEEPIGIDGTVLHAVERLLPFVARHAGYQYATTYIDGITW